MYIDFFVLFLCVVAIALWAYSYPNPSPLIKWLLPPKKRWPESQVRSWVNKGRYSKSFLKYFNRDPERCPPVHPGIVSPSDGMVMSLECRDEIRYVVIALSFWDMHVQRSPDNAVITNIQKLGDMYMDGEGRSFAFLAEKHCPVQIRISMKTSRGMIAVRLITSFSARRLLSFVVEGEQVMRGQRLSKILLGSTVVLELPREWPLSISCGQRVYAAETMIAKE